MECCSSMASDKRVLWVCRHGERINQVDPDWRHSARAQDDPPLSGRGIVQAKETGERLKSEQIDSIFASPFERCVHTAQLIVDARDTPIPIYLEQGITEALMFCQNPPGWLTWEALKAKYPAVDTDYEPICKELQPESPTDIKDCLPRIRDTLLQLVRKDKGNILLVSHSSSIGAIHEVLVNSWSYVGQCTLSKFVEQYDQQFKCQLNGDATHLSDQTNLRAYKDVIVIVPDEVPSV